MIKRVEPLLKFDQVLDYETPQARLTPMESMEAQVDRLTDLVGGRGMALTISATACIGFGVSMPGPIGGTLVLMGGVFVRLLLQHWARASRW